MAARFNRTDDEISQINMTPLVDVVMVLLIIFMVTSTTIVKNAIRVELPRAAAAGSTVSSTVNLVFTKDRELFLDGNPQTLEKAGVQLTEMVAHTPELQAVISADTHLSYGDVVEVIDVVKLAGVRSFALNIERRSVASR